ncbi:hypothetical protein [Nocardia sp. NPDC127526]|uniref:hypothetical protein n=1 Tax=Nocardia sp. NPDC127526 TaxID=3345393 RepID=UPI00362DD6F2
MSLLSTVDQFRILSDTVLAQVGNPTPEAPPPADTRLRLLRYAVWLAMLGGILAVFYALGRFVRERTATDPVSPNTLIIGITGFIVFIAGMVVNGAIP